MKINFKKILNELSYRVSSGIPDLTNEQHLMKLWDILKENNWNIDARVELLKNLQEKIGKVYVQKGKGPSGVKLQVGPRGGKYYMGNPKTGEPAPEAKKDDEKTDDKSDVKHSLKTDEQRNKKLAEVAELFVDNEVEKVRGAGRFTMSDKDVKDYRAWLKQTPEQQQKKVDEIKGKQIEKLGGDINDADIDNTLDILKDKLGSKKFSSLRQALKKKGDPPPENAKGERGNERLRGLVKFYLETGGVSPITNEVVPFFDSQLDHVVSLDNGGTDTADNWMWLEARINQFKGKLTDTEVEAKLIERGLMTADELNVDTDKKTLANWEKNAERAYWETKFVNGDTAGLTQEKIDNLSGEDLDNLVEGFNISLGSTKTEREANPNFIARYAIKKAKVPGSDKTLPVNRANSIRPDKDNPKSWGVSLKDDGTTTEPKYENDKDGFKKALADFDKARQSGGKKVSSKQVKENLKKVMEEKYQIPDKEDTEGIDEAFEAIQGEKIARERKIKSIEKASAENPKSSKNFKSKVDAEVKEKFSSKLKKVSKEHGKKSPEYRELKQQQDNYKLDRWREW